MIDTLGSWHSILSFKNISGLEADERSKLGMFLAFPM